MQIISKSPKIVTRVHNSPTRYLPGPQRNTTQIQRPLYQNEVYPHKRSTHRVQNYYEPEQRHYSANIRMDSSFPETEKQYVVVKPWRRNAQFITKGSTPRMTVGQGYPQEISGDDAEYVIVKKKIKQPMKVVEYSDDQDYESNYNEYENRPIETISILSKQHTSPKSIQSQKLVFQSGVRQKLPKAVGRQQFEPKLAGVNVNHVKKQRHSYKRSEAGPMPAPKLHQNSHRRLATTVEQYDEQYSKTQTQDEVENCQQIQQPEEHELVGYENDHQEQYEKIIYYKPKTSPFMKVKPVNNAINRQMEARYRDIQNILQTENDNLKEHNQYLLAVIKKMQTKDRKQRSTLSSKQAEIKRLHEQKEAYMERCYHLQNMLALTNQMLGKDSKQIHKQYSVLNLESNRHSKQTSTASEVINDTIQFGRQQSTSMEMDELRKHLKSAINNQNDNRRPVSSSNFQHNRAQQQMFSNQLTGYRSDQNFCNHHQEIPNTSIHNATPQFFSNNDSPQRRPRITARVSNSSNNSDPTSTIFNENSGIMNESNSFGGNWANSVSGFSVVNGLKNQLKTEGEPEDMSDINEDQQLRMKEEGLEGDDEKTAKNSNNQSKMLKYTTKADEEAVDELNFKFEELMKQYRVNHDVKIRKQCVEIAKKIKQLKSQIEKNQQINQSQGQQKQKKNNEMQITRVKSSHTRSQNMTSTIPKVKSN